MNGTGSSGQNSSIINISLKLIGIMQSKLKKKSWKDNDN